MITTILFDFYGVFLPDTYTAWLNAHGLTRTGAYQSVVEQLDNGTITPHEFYVTLSDLSKESIDSIEKTFHASPVINHTLVELLRSLAGRTIALTSNGTSHTRELMNAIGIEKDFDAVFISSEMGVSKPSPIFFKTVLESLHSSADETVLIDDSPANITSAQQYGLQTIHYTKDAELIDALAKLGISTKN